MEKHTPGPWFIENNGKCIDITASEGTGCKGDRYMRVGGTIDIADAMLIASAPDLLDALIAVMHSKDAYALDAARAAIAKATGEK